MDCPHCQSHQVVKNGRLQRWPWASTLAPYLPDFSAIENFWSKVKSILKTIGERTYQDLINAIEIAFEEASETDIKNWFLYGFYCAA